MSSGAGYRMRCPLQVWPMLWNVVNWLRSDPNVILLDTHSSYTCQLIIQVPDNAGFICRMFYMFVYTCKWVIVNTPVMIVSFTLVAWACDWSVLRMMMAIIGFVAGSYVYYWMHRAMHSFAKPPSRDGPCWPVEHILHSIARVHVRYHHGHVPYGKSIWSRIARDVAENVYEIATGGGAISLLPIPIVARTFAIIFAICALVMHHANCHRMHTKFHDEHHDSPTTNFMPVFWDNIHKTIREGPNIMRIVDENHTTWIAILVIVSAKLILPSWMFDL